MKRSPNVSEEAHDVLDVLGPTIEFLVPPSDSGAGYCVMRGTLPPNVPVPLHSHADDESFFVVSGSVQSLVQQEGKGTWREVKTGGFLHIPGGARHAFRNTSGEPVVQLVVTTPQLGRFFREVGKPVTPGIPRPPPTPNDLQHFAQVAAQYGHWLGGPAENAAIGISLPP